MAEILIVDDNASARLFFLATSVVSAELRKSRKDTWEVYFG